MYLLNIFMKHDLNILMIFGIKEKCIILTIQCIVGKTRISTSESRMRLCSRDTFKVEKQQNDPRHIHTSFTILFYIPKIMSSNTELTLCVSLWTSHTHHKLSERDVLMHWFHEFKSVNDVYTWAQMHDSVNVPKERWWRLNQNKRALLW